MQRGKDGRNDPLGEQFGALPGFGGFGFQRTMMPGLFGGRDPFDDPFFTRPFGDMFDGRDFVSRDAARTNSANGIVIQELDSDDDEEGKEEKGTSAQSMPSKEPSVEHPDDNPNEEEKIQNLNVRNEGTKSEARTFGFQTCKVTYGGVDGAYYTSSRTRRTGNDGVVLEESKEADKTTGQAKHRITRGINDKGHSVTRKLNADGKVDTMQMLHNLNEDELASFDKAWNGNVKGNLPGWNDGFRMHGNAGSSSDEQKGRALWEGRTLPSKEHIQNAGGRADVEAGTNSYGGRTKKVNRINIE
ncbi:hypothetical protein SLEP1_g2652 [Rubroshorea leprosula]|uniref:Myeloid leukemia factor n=1 Tax=Rubroshorea leprosula TaxID=152421 RepID=A0AAV5HIA1_9ROSI|nr:hypothetical protein SLEP1_g2652 [Rubroshorea leprosula]